MLQDEFCYQDFKITIIATHRLDGEYTWELEKGFLLVRAIFRRIY
jgi:hypothetical protein